MQLCNGSNLNPSSYSFQATLILDLPAFLLLSSFYHKQTLIGVVYMLRHEALYLEHGLPTEENENFVFIFNFQRHIL